jgi:hypothetical protein
MESLQKMLSDACDDSGEVQFRNDYSGRAMYGRRCVGITGSWKDCQAVMASVTAAMAQDLFDTAINTDDSDREANEAYDLNDRVQEKINEIMSFTFDSMGLDTIIYWPSLEPLEEDDEQLPSDAQFDEMSEDELTEWVSDHSEYHTDEDDVESLKMLRKTAKLMRDRISEDVPG